MIHTQTVIRQEGFRNVLSSILEPQEANSREVEQKRRAGKEEGRAWVRSRHCEEQPSLLCSVLFFDSFLRRYTVGPMIFCLRPGELITIGDLFTRMFYTSCSCAFSFICTQHFLPLPQFFPIFTKCKWRDFFFFLTVFTEAGIH